jgi:hypothetical protein
MPQGESAYDMSNRDTSGEKHPSITTDPWYIVYKRGLEDEAIKTVVYYKGFFEAC